LLLLLLQPITPALPLLLTPPSTTVFLPTVCNKDPTPVADGDGFDAAAAAAFVPAAAAAAAVAKHTPAAAGHILAAAAAVYSASSTMCSWVSAT
jgi:hypothetical protein